MKAVLCFKDIIVNTATELHHFSDTTLRTKLILWLSKD